MTEINGSSKVSRRLSCNACVFVTSLPPSPGSFYWSCVRAGYLPTESGQVLTAPPGSLSASRFPPWLPPPPEALSRVPQPSPGSLRLPKPSPGSLPAPSALCRLPQPSPGSLGRRVAMTRHDPTEQSPSTRRLSTRALQEPPGAHEKLTSWRRYITARRHRAHNGTFSPTFPCINNDEARDKLWRVI